MWQSLGYLDFSILHTYPWYLQKVALKKLWKETKINQDHPVRNNCHSSYTFLGLTFFSHKWFQFTVVLQSVSWKKYRPHEWREDFTCTKAKRFFFAIRNHTSQVLELSCRLRTWIFEVQRKFHTFSDWLKGVPRDMFSWIAANNKQKIWRRSCWIDKMVASKE